MGRSHDCSSRKRLVSSNAMPNIRTSLVTGNTGDGSRRRPPRLARGGDRVLISGRDAERGAEVLTLLDEAGPGLDHAASFRRDSIAAARRRGTAGQPGRALHRPARRDDLLRRVFATVPERTTGGGSGEGVRPQLLCPVTCSPDTCCPLLADCPIGFLWCSSPMLDATATLWTSNKKNLQARDAKPVSQVADVRSSPTTSSPIELAGRCCAFPVQVTCVDPGMVKTDVFRNARGPGRLLRRALLLAPADHRRGTGHRRNADLACPRSCCRIGRRPFSGQVGGASEPFRSGPAESIAGPPSGQPRATGHGIPAAHPDARERTLLLRIIRDRCGARLIQAARNGRLRAPGRQPNRGEPIALRQRRSNRRGFRLDRRGRGPSGSRHCWAPRPLVSALEQNGSASQPDSVDLDPPIRCPQLRPKTRSAGSASCLDRTTVLMSAGLEGPPTSGRRPPDRLFAGPPGTTIPVPPERPGLTGEAEAERRHQRVVVQQNPIGRPRLWRHRVDAQPDAQPARSPSTASHPPGTGSRAS